MAYTYEQLKDMTVAQLREIAAGVQHDDVKGSITMHKEKLLPALCHALGVDTYVHHHAVGSNKSRIKTQLRKLKADRDAALARKDSEGQRAARKEIHRLKHKLNRSIV